VAKNHAKDDRRVSRIALRNVTDGYSDQQVDIRARMGKANTAFCLNIVRKVGRMCPNISPAQISHNAIVNSSKMEEDS